MRFETPRLLAVAGFASALAFATPAAANFARSTSEGPMYFDGASGNYGRFMFLDSKNQLKKDVKIYINGVGPQYTDNFPGVRSGTYDAQWFNYDDDECGREAVDPDGGVARSWGVMSITVKQDNDYFTADVWQCENNESLGKFEGTPG